MSLTGVGVLAMKNSVVALSAFWAVSGCASANLSQLASAAPLVGTQWRLTEYRPADEAIGTVRPDAGEVYMLTLQPDGGVVAQLACNRGSGRWHSRAAGAQRGPLALDISSSTLPPARRAPCRAGRATRTRSATSSSTMAGSTSV